MSLLKFEGNKKLVYKFSLGNFNTDTLQDGNVQWSLYNNDRTNMNISKLDTGLNIDIHSSDTRQLNLSLEQFGLENKAYAVEMTLTIPYYDYTCYCGSSVINYTASVREFSGYGLWCYRLGNIYIKEGSLTYGGIGYEWSRVTGFTAETRPIRYKVEIDPVSKKAKAYLDDKLIFESTHSSILKSITFNNGGSGGVTFVLHDLKIYTIKNWSTTP